MLVMLAPSQVVRLTRPLCSWNSPGKNTELSCSSLLQGIFLTQGLNPGLLHGRWILYHLSHQGGPLAPSVYAQIKIHILARPMDSICKQSNFKAVILHLDF